MPIQISPSAVGAALRMATAGCAFLAMSAAANAATQADCDKIAHSSVPYEVTMRIGEITIKYQVYRSADHVTKLLVKQPDGNVSQLENQSTFPKAMTMPNGQTAKFEYSVPTDKPVYDQAVKTIDMKLVHDKDVLMETPLTMQYLPDEKVKLGACTYDAKHYVQTSSKNGRESRNEIWYSPGLEFSIKTVSALKAGDQQVSKQSEAVDLTTSFEPFK